MLIAMTLPHYKEEPKAVAPLLVGALEDPEARVRITAAESLGQLGPIALEAIPALTRALKDDHARVREQAEKALELIRNKR
ncbi:MAG: HEAT repeat domain-containing protein [Gemmataceae bacterium]